MATSFLKLLLNQIIFHIFLNFIIINCEEECPKESPIYNTIKQSCSLEYCTESQFLNNTCIIANNYTKIRWLNRKTIIGESDNSQIYPTIALDENQNLLFETTIGKKSKIFMSLETDGKPYTEELKKYELKKTGNDNFLYNFYPISFLTTVDSHRIFYSLSSQESFGIFDLDEKKFTEKNFENILGYKIKSNINSLLKTNQNNVYIYAYITLENRLAMQKIKFLKNDIQIITTLIEDKKTIPRNSRKCAIFKYSESEIIECIDMDEDQVYYVRIYDINLNFIEEYKLDENKSPRERAFYTYNDVYYTEESRSIFILYTDTGENGAKPFLYWKEYSGTKFNNIVSSNKKYELFKGFDYYFSDVDNALTSINEGYIILATMTMSENRHLMITLFDIVEKYLILIYYIDIPLKDLYNINYFSRLYAFPFNSRFGIGFVEEINNNKYQSSFILFHFANTTDIEPVNNIFSFHNKINDTLYTINPFDYINLENNIFCYSIKGVYILEYPDPETGIEILITDSKNETTKFKDASLSIDGLITISYSKEINEIQKGNYEITFVPILEEIGKDEFINSLSKTDSYINNNIGLEWSQETYLGRKFKFKFTVGNCHKNCLTCFEESSNDLNQKCMECISGYYFLENTNNCYNYTPVGYFFNTETKIFSQCHDNCATCSGKSNNEIQNCLSCRDNYYLLYNNSNCLNCKFLNLFANYEQTECKPYIPSGYYLNDSRLNTINKCHENCYSCKAGPDGDNMNCEYCVNNFYLIENTNNCESQNLEGYYLDKDLKLKKCHPFCKTCLKGSSGDKMNCESCDYKKGYFLNSTNSNCEFKEIDNFYYIPENDSYLPCYEKCLMCFDKEEIRIDDMENNYLIMNCLSCYENDSYYLLTKNGNNCLNCKSENKYVNIEETDCIDTLPEGFYILNNETNQIDKCYEKCKTCSEKGFSDDDMKCDSCYTDQGLFLWKGNCVKSMGCDSFFYYKSNLEQIIDSDFNMEKVCLNDKSECPNSLPFYSTSNLECTSMCDLESFFGEGCKISVFDEGLYEILNKIQNEYKFDIFEKFFAYINNNNSQILILDIQLFDYEGNISKTTINLDQNIKRMDSEEYLKLPKNSKFIEQEINIEQCLEVLGNNSIINIDTKLRVLKIDINNFNTSLNHYYFQLLDEGQNFQKINLSLCNNLYNNITINLEKLISQKRAKIKKEEIYLNKHYSTDKCSATYDENGADLLLEDRIILNNRLNIDNDNNDIDNEIILYLEEICPINCTLINFDNETFTAYCSCPILNNYIFDEKIKIENLIKNNSEVNDTYNIEKNIYMIIKEESQKESEIENDKISIESNANIKYMQCINSISSQFKNNYVLIIMMFFDIGYLIILILYCCKYRKLYINPPNLKLDKNNIGYKYRPGLKSSYTYKIGNNPPKSREIKLKSNIFSSVNSDLQSINNNDNNNINKYNYNKKNNKFNNNNLGESTSRYNSSITFFKNKYIDYDLEEYEKVLKEDKRSCLNIFISISKKKHIFIFAFISDNYAKLLKISILIFTIINYFTTNVFFFNDKVIHQIYLDKGDYNSNYQTKNIFLSALISSLFLWITKIIFLVKKSDKHSMYYLKFVNWFFVIYMLLLIFYWLYVGSFTSVFIKSQKHLSFNFLLTIIICILYEFILSLISTILRFIALKNRKSPFLYKISVSLILLKR